MMITSSRGKGTTKAKQENEGDHNNESTKTTSAIASSSRQWSAFRNPRIVRVSRSFPGKDRHSKVCTIRGLRDRRIRLSVPTAVQLYDLQDRLGLTQPSKVIDWLLDVTKDDIDNLPPLQMPPGFGQLHLHDSIPPLPQISPFFEANLHHHSHNNFHEAEGSFSGQRKLIRTNEEEEDDDENGLSLSAQKLFPLASTNSSSFFNINDPPNMQLNPYSYHWDASNLSLSHQIGLVPQPPENNSLSLNTCVSMPPAAGAGGSQFFYCQSPATLPAFFPQYPAPFANAHLENNETREFSHFHLLNTGFGDSQRNNSGRQSNKDQNSDL